MSDPFVRNLQGVTNPCVFLDGSHRAVLELPSLFLGRGHYKPGWRWSTHAGAQTGQPSARHIGLIESGRMRLRSADGTERTVGPGDAFELTPGHDAWVIGEAECVALDFECRTPPTG